MTKKMREFLIATLTGLIAIDLVLCGLLCHQCSRIPYPRDCDVIGRCGDSEACFIDKEVNSNGDVLYSTGCRSKQRCGALAAHGALTQRSEDAVKENTPISNVTVQDTPPEDTMDVLVCDQCCDTNFCNVKGCGSQDFPPRSDRGPVCLSCHQHLHPGTCDRVELCTIDEQCYVLPVSSTFDVIYSSGCMPTSQCLSINTTQPDALPLIGKRSVGTRCNSCCAEDYCNINCTMTEPAIVLTSVKHTSTTQRQTSRTTTDQVTASPEPAHATSNILITQVGTWSAWSYYGACSTTCGFGTFERTRQCQGGTSCPGNAMETSGCYTGICPTVGTWSAWSYYGACSTTCGVGTFERTRQCQGGTGCPGIAKETPGCNTRVCPTVGTWSAWSYYGACSTTCGVGNMQRTRQCQGGTGCPGNAKETSGCNTRVCPTAPTWGQWGSWVTCSVTCGSGIQYRLRTCTGGNGVCQGSNYMVQNCDTNVQCPVSDCKKDIVFMLDDSGSVGAANFRYALDFVRNIVTGLDIGYNSNQVALMAFSTHPLIWWYLNSYHNKTSILNAVNNVQYASGVTNTADALLAVKNNVLISQRGDRDAVRNVVIVLSDGVSIGKTHIIQAASELHTVSDDVISIVVGTNAESFEMTAIASDSHHVMYVSGFPALNSIIPQLLSVICS